MKSALEHGRLKPHPNFHLEEEDINDDREPPLDEDGEVQSLFKQRVSKLKEMEQQS